MLCTIGRFGGVSQGTESRSAFCPRRWVQTSLSSLAILKKANTLSAYHAMFLVSYVFILGNMTGLLLVSLAAWLPGPR